MAQHPPPGTDWQEKIAPDEAERYAAYARMFQELQQRGAQRHGAGRTLHRKQLVAAQGTLEVLDGVASFARQGIFAQPRDYEVLVRLSNGAPNRAADRVPDVRGFALRVLGVQGPSALGNGPATCQDFTFINHESFAFRNSDEFVDLVMAKARGNGEVVKHLFKRYGLLGGPRKMGTLIKYAGKPFSGFATENLFTAVPIANGPYAVRLRLVPAPSNGSPEAGAREDLAGDVATRLRRAPLHWDLQLQYYTSEAVTPIEDASVNWPTPYFTVARLMLPQQDLHSAQARALAEKVEGGLFDPWQALADHRPLGDVQRARKVVYFASQQGRGAA
ncbi:MAG: catalase [Burkholderiales bacterium]|nr:catalase [Burkholderiales bacterium]